MVDAAALSTELDRVTRELNHLRRALEHQERLATLGTIAGLIAHEFNNILTPVCSYAQMALDAPDDAALALKTLGKVLAGAERASRIAGAILGFVRTGSGGVDTGSQAGGLVSDGRACSTWNTVPRPGLSERANDRSATLKPPRCALGPTFEEALACLGRDPARDGIHVASRADPELAAAIRPIALQHVVLNLLLNARNALLPGGGRVTFGADVQFGPVPAELGEVSSLDACSTWNTSFPTTPIPAEKSEVVSEPGARRWVVITLEDTGRGMSADRLARLFVPYTTSDDAEAKEQSPIGGMTGGDGKSKQEPQRPERRRGTGLGMTLCKRLVEDAGGYILVRSEPGRGTRVRIVLQQA